MATLREQLADTPAALSWPERWEQEAAEKRPRVLQKKLEDLGIVVAGKYFFWLDLAAMAILFATANFIIYNGLRLPELFAGIEEKPKYRDSPLTAEEKRRYSEKLSAYMVREKPYLNSSLSLNELAGAVALAPRHLSQVINEHFRQNFYDFVNSYRIEDAKQRLLDQSRNRNVLEILYEVGFNSKSAFNLAFKTHTGLTPTEYRKKTFSAIPA
jgi:AraC-like DNA-binding protein